MAEFGWFNAPLIVAIVLSIWATIAVMIARDYARNARRGAQHRFLDVSGPGVLSATDGKRDIAKAEYVKRKRRGNIGASTGGRLGQCGLGITERSRWRWIRRRAPRRHGPSNLVGASLRR